MTVRVAVDSVQHFASSGIIFVLRKSESEETLSNLCFTASKCENTLNYIS